MKIIISPAKKMQDASSDFEIRDTPLYLAKTKQLLQRLQRASYPELQRLWKCSEKLARLNYQRLQDAELQYSSMAPDLLEAADLEYLEQNLRILSGFYGILRPFDGVIQYRLEMGAKLVGATYQDLYEFWGAELYTELYRTQEPVINLASKEYSKAIERYLAPNDVFVTLEFKEFDPKRQKYVQKATHAKQARGQFVRYLAKQKVKTLEQLKEFDELGYRFVTERSTAKKYIFLKE